MIVQVAVGVVFNSLTEILMTRRALSLHQGGLWELPGGKIEKNESIEDALIRELKEELNLDVQVVEPFIIIEHHYPEKSVQLHVNIVKQYTGEPEICDGQLDLQWVSLYAWNNDLYPVPPSNLEIMNRLFQQFA